MIHSLPGLSPSFYSFLMFKAWIVVLFLVLDVFRYGRTPVAAVLYVLFLRHLCMSLRKIARAISPFVSRSCNAVWRWEKRLKGLKNVFASKCSVSIYLVGDRRAWIIVAYEPFQKKLFGIWLTHEKKEHNELVKKLLPMWEEDMYVVACMELDKTKNTTQR